jgi:hypothetical protein
LVRGKRRTGQARGRQRIEWIPIGSQVPSGIVAVPPHPSRSAAEISPGMALATFAMAGAPAVPGPPGTVPVLRKGPVVPRAGKPRPDGPPDVMPGGQYFHAQVSQPVINYGCSANLNVWRPQVESQTNHDHSIVQTWLYNSQNPLLQTLEAGWEVCPTEYGDALPHLFVFYTTNGYTKNGDGLGGMNFDYKGWVQVDRTIMPTGIVTNTSAEDGQQVIVQIRYELLEGNWWLSVNDVFVGYYPASLFMPGQSRFNSLGDHADQITFGGEVLSMEPDPVTSRTSMGSGFFAEGGLGRACFVSNMEIQSDRRGTMAPLNGNQYADNPGLYDVQSQMLSTTPMGSYLFAGGPGAQASKRAPALAQTPRKAMALAFVADDQANQILACTTPGPFVDNTWSGNTPSGQSSKMAPSLALLNDTLFMAFVANDDSNQLLICSSNAIGLDARSLHLPSPGRWTRRPAACRDHIRTGPRVPALRCSAGSRPFTGPAEYCIRCNSAHLRRGDERMPQRVRPDRFADPGPSGGAADDAPGAVPVQAAAVGGQEDRSVGSFTDGQVDRPGRARRERDRHDLAAFADDHERAVAALDSERLDVCARGLGHPQAIEGQQRDQRMFRRRAKPGCDQQCAHLVAVQPGRMGLVVQARPTDVRGR